MQINNFTPGAEETIYGENKWHVATHSGDLSASALRSKEPKRDVAAKNCVRV